MFVGVDYDFDFFCFIYCVVWECWVVLGVVYWLDLWFVGGWFVFCVVGVVCVGDVGYVVDDVVVVGYGFDLGEDDEVYVVDVCGDVCFFFGWFGGLLYC